MKWISMSAIPIHAKTMPPAWIKLEDSRVSVCQVRAVSDKGRVSRRAKIQSPGRVASSAGVEHKIVQGEAK